MIDARQCSLYSLCCSGIQLLDSELEDVIGVSVRGVFSKCKLVVESENENEKGVERTRLAVMNSASFFTAVHHHDTQPDANDILSTFQIL